MMSSFAIVELDQLLAEDNGGGRVRALQKMLVDAAEQCRLQLDGGVTPQEAKRLSAMTAACHAGSSLLPVLWQIQQERK